MKFEKIWSSAVEEACLFLHGSRLTQSGYKSIHGVHNSSKGKSGSGEAAVASGS